MRNILLQIVVLLTLGLCQTVGAHVTYINGKAVVIADQVQIKEDGSIGISSTQERIAFDGSGNLIKILGADVQVPDNLWLGLGSADGRIEFDDLATDEVNILNANVGIGTAGPGEKLDVKGNILLGKTATSEIDYAAKASYLLKLNGNYWNSSTGNSEVQVGAIYGIPANSNVTPEPAMRLILQSGINDVMSLLSTGNVGIGTSSFGTSAVKVLAMGTGTAPVTSPIDVAQVWVADRGGIAGKAGLHIRAEDGTQHVFSDLVGIGTVTPTAGLDIISTNVYAGDYVGLRVQSNILIGNTNTLRGLNGAGTAGLNIAWIDGSDNLNLGTTNSTILHSGSSGERWRITSTGILQSNGAQTIQTSTGNLTLATAAGNGNIVLSPNGTGAVQATNLTPTDGALRLNAIATSNIFLGTTNTRFRDAGNTLTVMEILSSNAVNIYSSLSMAGHLLFSDNTYDIGASGATRPRNLYLAGDATIGDQLIVSGAGPHAIGGATAAATQVRILGNYPVNQAGASRILSIESSATNGLNQDVYGIDLNGVAFTTTGTVSDIIGVRLGAPGLTIANGSVANASTFKIIAAPTGATNNYALWVDAGVSRFGGDVRMDSREYHTPLAITIADNTVGASPAAYTLDPVAKRVQLTINDPDGANITMGETNALDGMELVISNRSTVAANFSDTVGVSELTGAIALGQYDTLALEYDVDRWIQSGTSNN